jgi:hypothetical protein
LIASSRRAAPARWRSPWVTEYALNNRFSGALAVARNEAQSDSPNRAQKISESEIRGLEGCLEKIWNVLGWIFSVVILVISVFGCISERKYSGYANSLEFFGAFIVLGLAINPLVLRSVKLFGRPSVTMLVGAMIAVGLLCYASLHAA